MKVKNTLLFPIISILSGFIVSFLALEVLLRILPTSESLNHLPVNADNPIIRLEENRDFIWSKGWDFSINTRKHTNNYGFLNYQDYNSNSKTPLMAIIGDSFVNALEVDNKQTMHEILAQKISDKGRVYSFGAGGAPLSTYLMFAEYARDEFKPDSMVFIIIENDFDESFLKYRNRPGFYYFSPSADANGTYKLERVDYTPSRLKRIMRKFTVFRYVILNLQTDLVIIKEKMLKALYGKNKKAKNTEKQSVEATQERVTDSKKAVDEFLRQLPLRTGLPSSRILFLIDGIRPLIYDDSDWSDAAASYYNYFSAMRNYFVDAANEKGYEVIDMQPFFIERHRKDGSRFEFETDMHWNQLGHKLVAEKIESSLLFKKTFGQ